MNFKLQTVWLAVLVIGFLIGFVGVWVGFKIEQAIFIAMIVGALVGYFHDKIEPLKWGHGGSIEELESELDELKEEIHKLKKKI